MPAVSRMAVKCARSFLLGFVLVCLQVTVQFFNTGPHFPRIPQHLNLLDFIRRDHFCQTYQFGELHLSIIFTPFKLLLSKLLLTKFPKNQ